MKTNELTKNCYKVLVTIQVRKSMSMEVVVDIQEKFEFALEEAMYIAKTQKLKTRIVHEMKTTHYYQEIEL